MKNLVPTFPKPPYAPDLAPCGFWLFEFSKIGFRVIIWHPYKNSTECESRFYSQTKRIFSGVIPAVEGLLQEGYVQRGNNSSVIMMVSLREFFATPYFLVAVHFSILWCSVYLFPYLTSWSVEMWLGVWVCIWSLSLAAWFKQVSSKKGWFCVGIVWKFYVEGEYTLSANVRAFFSVLTERRSWKIWTRSVLKKLCVFVLPLRM